MNLKAIGQRIKQAREIIGLTQEQLAEKVNLSTSHMSVIERGVKPPKLETFVEIVNVLKVDANSILADVLSVSNEIVSSQLSSDCPHFPRHNKEDSWIMDTLIQETMIIDKYILPEEPLKNALFPCLQVYVNRQACFKNVSK
jgi:transcriptional regulator with XRE-family HTH domain